MNEESEQMGEGGVNESTLNKDLPDSYYNGVDIQSSVNYEINEQTFKSRNLLGAVLYSHNNSCAIPPRYEHEKCEETLRNECTMETEYDSFNNTYYCDVCQVVTESFTVYKNHLRGERHAKMVQIINSGEAIQTSVNSVRIAYPVLFPGPVEKLFSSTQGTIKSQTPLPSEKIEIPELGDAYYSEFHEAADFFQSTSHFEADDYHSLKSFDTATSQNASERNNQVIEREIDEFLKSIAQKNGCRQISSEAKDANKAYSYTSGRRAKTSKLCETKRKHRSRHEKLAFSGNKSTVTSLDNSRSDSHSNISDSRMSNENVLESITRKKKRSDSDSDSSSQCSFHHTRNNSLESVICMKSHEISSKESVKNVLSGESTTERKSKNLKTSKDREFRKGHSAMRVYKKHKKEHSKIKRVKKTDGNETESRGQFHHNKYPHPPLGVYRKKMEAVSVIQKVVEHLKYPCVALDRLIEIQGLHKTHYYCELCDLPCSYRSILKHLESFEHKMQCMKEFVPLIYENYSKHSKHEIENKVNKALKILEDMFVCGKIRIEKEYLNDGDLYSSTRKEKQTESECQHSSNQIQYSSSSSSTSVELIDKAESEFYKSIHNSSVRRHISSHQNQFSTNYKPRKKVTGASESGFESEFYKSVHNSSVRRHISSHENQFSTNYNPMKKVTGTSESNFSYNIQKSQGYQQIMSYQNRSFFDYDRKEIPRASEFYCNSCNAFMTGKKNWELHITGGRHITNVKRARGEFPFRRRPVLVPNACANLMNELDKIKEPVVGLDMMKETQDSDAPGPMYSCSLCHHNTTSVDIIDHILSQKHRFKFLEKIRHPSLQALKQRDIGDHKIIRNICAEVERMEGRGYLSVYIRSAEFEYRSYENYATRKRRSRYYSGYI